MQTRLQAAKRYEWGLVAGLALLALVLRLYGLTRESLWYDEAYSIWISEMEIASPRIIWEWNVPFALYYVMLHYWMLAFGQGEFAVRALSVMLGAASVFPMYVLGQTLFDRRMGAVGALLLALNPYHLWYSQEARMYSAAVLLVIVSLYLFWQLIHRGGWGWWVAHSVVTGLTFHIHYYIGWVVLVQNVYYLLWLRAATGGVFSGPGWRKLRWWLLDQVATMLLALPAMIIFLNNLTDNHHWNWLSANHSAPGWRDVLNLLVSYTLGTTFAGPGALRWAILLLFVLLAAWGVVAVARQPEVRRRWGWAVLLVVLTLLLPGALIFALGQLAAIWVTRYLILFMPAFLLLVALGATRLPTASWRVAAVVLLLAGSVYGLENMFRARQKEDWRGVAAHLMAHGQAQDVIVLMDDECRVPFNYYFGTGGTRIELSRFADETVLDQAVDEIWRKQNGGQLWLVISHADSSALEARIARLPGLSPVEQPSFVGIKLLAYRVKS